MPRHANLSPLQDTRLKGGDRGPDGLPFAIHHHNLAQAGIHQIQNANLGALAKGKVWLSCTMILPLRAQGASGSPVRPVSIGAPGR